MSNLSYFITSARTFCTEVSSDVLHEAQSLAFMTGSGNQCLIDAQHLIDIHATSDVELSDEMKEILKAVKKDQTDYIWLT